MSKVMIIAEAACTWLHGGLEAAYKSIKAAKECGADAWKTQWTSDPLEMGKRRGMDGEKYRRLAWDPSWHELLAARCKEYGIEYMVTTFILKDITTIAPLVKRFKISNYEGSWLEFVDAHLTYGKQVIISKPVSTTHERDQLKDVRTLQCVSQYPCPLEEVRISSIRGCKYTDYGRRMTWLPNCDGISDHSTSVLTGAVAVGAGARIIEKHVRLSDTPSTDPDYGHSLIVDGFPPIDTCFAQYVDNIREAERML